MPRYYCTDEQVTDLLPANLTNSAIDTSGKRASKLRQPATAWIDSVYPSLAPFSPSTAAASWAVNQADHAAGDLVVAIDTGSGDPVVGDYFTVDGHNNVYKVSSYAAGSLGYTVAAKAAFADNAELVFGPPQLIQLAAAWYCVSLAYQVIRNSPEDKAAAEAMARAKELLHIPENGQYAKARPWMYDPDALDAADTDKPFSQGYIRLTR